MQQNLALSMEKTIEICKKKLEEQQNCIAQLKSEIVDRTFRTTELENQIKALHAKNEEIKLENENHLILKTTELDKLKRLHQKQLAEQKQSFTEATQAMKLVQEKSFKDLQTQH